MIRRSLPRRTAAATAAAAGVVALAACGGNTQAQPVPTATPTPPSPAVQAVRDASAAFQAYVEDFRGCCSGSATALSCRRTCSPVRRAGFIAG